MSFKKKFMIYLMTVATAFVVTVGSASACTMLYVGSDNTVTGDTYMSRSEDYSNSYNKIAYVSEHGKHPAGSSYQGCYLTFTFTHDSYAYTAVSDDNVIGSGNEDGECPNCGKTHRHTPMEEGGANEMGLCISAMDSVYGNSAVKKVDPLKSERTSAMFMSEGDMNTILLGECATAKEAVDLLLSIYDEYGVNEGSGLQISDQNETWYVENYSGTQYIAIKLSSQTVAFNANVGIIGLVDLDDTDNVIASSKVIEVAKAAGTYVGDEEANTIDFRASYSNLSLNSRVWDGLNYLCGVDTFTKESTTPDDITITNVKDGNIVPVYSNIQLKDKFATKDMVDFYKVSSIGKSGNLEWHIFQISAQGDAATSIVEWQGINHGGYSVAIPYYPVLTTDVYEGYKVGGLGGVARASAAPADGYGYYANGSRFMVYPKGWENGVYWTNDLLSNYAASAACTDADREMVHANLAVMQQKCYDTQAEMASKLAGMDTAAAKAYATEQSAALAKEAHGLALDLYKHIACSEHKACLVNEKAATCVEEGYTGDTVCAFCNELIEQGEAIGLVDHCYSASVVAPTKDAQGYTEYTCSVCGDSYKDSFTIAAPVTISSNKASSGKPMLTWDAVDGAVKYKVYRATAIDGKYVKMFTTDGTSYCNTNSKAGEKYFYKVVAIGADGTKSEFSAVKGITCDCKQPVVSVKLSNGHPKLSWKAVDGATKYLIYRSTDGENFILWDNTTNTSFTNANSKAGTTYYYQVKAVCTTNYAANSALSNVVSIAAK